MRYRQGDRYLITSFPKDNGLLLDPGYGTGKKKNAVPSLLYGGTNQPGLPSMCPREVLRAEESGHQARPVTSSLWACGPPK